MSSPEQFPEDGNGKTFTIRLSRDSIILLAAVGFLGVAILVAVLFGNPSGTATTPNPAATRATVGSVPESTTTQRMTAVAAQPSPTEASPATPLRPTLAPIEPAVTSSLAVGPGTPPAYPGPANQTPPLAQTPPIGPATVTPAAPIFQPTVLVPTAQIIQPTLPIAPTEAIPTPPPLIPTPPLGPPTLLPVVTPSAPISPPVRPTARPTAPPITVLRGTTYWRTDKSPYTISQNISIPAGSALIIEPGVEVRLAPGVTLFANGKLFAIGKPGQPVRFVGTTPQRWEGIFGQAGSEIVLEQVEVRGGGAGGTVLASEGGTLALRNARITDNGGHIQSNNSRLEVRDTEIAGNDMPYGAALAAFFGNGGSTTITNNRIGGNRLSAGSPALLLQNDSGFEALSVTVQNNLLISQTGPDLTLATNTMELRGSVTCNTLVGGSDGLSLRSETNQTPGFPLTIRDNVIDDHLPPIIPVYLKYGIGRGATSEVQIDMRNNWWGSDLGPYEPDRLADGRGDSVGENIAFDPWLRSWPACAPRP